MTNAGNTSPPEEVLVDGVVFRLVKPKHPFPPDAIKPLALHFSFSSEEEQLGKQTQRWLLSVWDLGRTQVAEAVALASTPGERIAFGLPVVSVNSITLGNDANPISIVRDVDPADKRQGASGHCGLRGLHRNRTERKALQDKLVERAYRL